MLSTATTKHTPLPSWALDDIANGAQKDSDDMRPVFTVTHRLACSGRAHGLTETDWRNAMQDGVKNGEGPPSNKLWQQITRRRGRKVKFHTYDQFLSKAWAWAEENVAKGCSPKPDKQAESAVLFK